MTGPKPLTQLSADMLRWLHEAALPLWWDHGADHSGSGFHEALDGEGRPVHANRRARVQARQVYVYATAGTLGWRGPWREAVAHGLDFFVARYQRRDGLFRTIVSPAGEVVDDSAWLYDQAFALFAMAQAASALPERRPALMTAAHGLRQALDAWRLPEGGFREPEARYDRQSNPHMHLFEAALAWSEVDPDPAWPALADEVAELAMGKFTDTRGALHEFFIEGWAPAPGIDGRIVEPGHQFEWAWLLTRWGRSRGKPEALRAARAMYDIGQRSGVRASNVAPAVDVATQQLLDDGSIHDDVARLWPQTERIKAAVALEDQAESIKGVAGLKLYLDRRPAGLWWDKLRPDGTFVDEPAPASSFYHIICAIAELKSGRLSLRMRRLGGSVV